MLEARKEQKKVGKESWCIVASSFRELIAYQKAYQVALDLHNLTLGFPKFEHFELGSQLRRSSKSVATNIAEGYGRKANSSLADFKRFIRIALASNDETRVHLDFCKDLGYINVETHSLYENLCIETGKLLTSMLNWKF